MDNHPWDINGMEEGDSPLFVPSSSSLDGDLVATHSVTRIRSAEINYVDLIFDFTSLTRKSTLQSRSYFFPNGCRMNLKREYGLNLVPLLFLPPFHF